VSAIGTPTLPEGTAVTLTAPSPSPTTARSPLAARAAAGLLVLLATTSTFGLVMFGFVWSDEPFGAGLVFTAFMLATAVTAVAAVPSLLRGEVLGWALTFGWGCCYTYWSVYKVFGEREFESTGFLLAGCGVVALLASRPARVHAGIAR
jgi:hypothetical protein